MSGTNKIIIGTGGILAAFGVFWLLVRRKKFIAMNNNTKLSDLYSPELVKVVDAIYRLETANYTSNIFQKTNGAGIIAISKNFPFGWLMLSGFWNANAEKAPTGIYSSENGFDYLKFPTVLAGQQAVAEIIKTRHNQGFPASAYYSLDEEKQNEYAAKLVAIDGSLANSKYL